MAMSRGEILQKVQDVLVDALGVDDDEVTTEATLMGDLGAESIDFLDIVFRLEKAFEIKIPREELFPAETLMNDSNFVSDGKLTEAGLAELKAKMAHTEIGDFADDPDINKLGDLGHLSRFLDHLIYRLLVHPLESQGIGYVVVHCHVRPDSVVLKDHAHLAFSWWQVRHVRIANIDSPLGHFFQSGNHTHAGRLPASRRAQQSGDLARGDIQIEIADGDHFFRTLEDFREPVQVNLRHDYSPPSAALSCERYLDAMIR